MARPEIRELVKPGMRVAIGVGSRGIGCIHQVVRTQFNEVSASAAKRSWARLIKQVSEADPLICPKCAGPMRIIAFIERPEVIEKILTHLGLWPTHIHSPPAGVATGLIAA
jgi:hypothetical protein